MKTSLRFLPLLGVLLLSAAVAHESGEPLTESQQAFLARYESVRAALAADDLTAAQKAVAAIADIENAENLAQATTLAEAREAFQKLSKRAAHLAKDQEGYYLVHCPMVAGGKGDWVQTNSKISNPYFGKSMLTCGSLTSGAKKADEHDKHH